MVLKHPALAHNERLRNAAHNKPPLAKGETGTAVVILQAALLDLKYKLPKSVQKSGVPDGIFGAETYDALVEFQKAENLPSKDGIAGKDTLAHLDQKMCAIALPKKIAPSMPAPSTSEYQLGTANPPVRSDPGAGACGSTPVTATALVQRNLILEVLPPRGLNASTFIGADAARHMKHYLDASGGPLTIDLAGMVRGVPSAKARFLAEVNQAKKFAEMLPPGNHAITSKRGEGGYNRRSESTNWNVPTPDGPGLPRS